jgi:hypothetical protein
MDYEHQQAYLHSDHWDKRRRSTIRRDHAQCQLCGVRNTQLHVHHLDDLRPYDEDGIENLITLCTSCHRRLHSSSSENRNLILDEIANRIKNQNEIKLSHPYPNTVYHHYVHSKPLQKTPQKKVEYKWLIVVITGIFIFLLLISKCGSSNSNRNNYSSKYTQSVDSGKIYKKVSADALNVRTDPSVNGIIKFKIYKGNSVEIIGTYANGWVEIRFGNKTGYVNSEYLY